ncbi:MAG: hypothetical protein DRI26_04895 [Chloroflexi bacterium]|nr:MAG: hypothetical protein DRI26_04895 [Chloroflexota bacterium]
MNNRHSYYEKERRRVKELLQHIWEPVVRADLIRDLVFISWREEQELVFVSGRFGGECENSGR